MNNPNILYCRVAWRCAMLLMPTPAKCKFTAAILGFAFFSVLKIALLSIYSESFLVWIKINKKQHIFVGVTIFLFIAFPNSFVNFDIFFLYSGVHHSRFNWEKIIGDLISFFFSYCYCYYFFTKFFTFIKL